MATEGRRAGTLRLTVAFNPGGAVALRLDEREPHRAAAVEHDAEAHGYSTAPVATSTTRTMAAHFSILRSTSFYLALFRPPRVYPSGWA